MKKKSKIMISSLTALIMTASIAGYAFAANGYEIKSHGIIAMDVNKDGDYFDAEDVYINAAEFKTIEKVIIDNKTELIKAIDPTYDISSGIPTYNEINTKLKKLVELPDNYYYNAATKGDDIERFVKEGGSYFPCDEHGVKTSDTAENVSGKNLVKYVAANENNLSVGNGGYGDNELELGNSVDVENAYLKGKIDSQLSNIQDKTIEYVYHVHSSSSNNETKKSTSKDVLISNGKEVGSQGGCYQGRAVYNIHVHTDSCYKENTSTTTCGGSVSVTGKSGVCTSCGATFTASGAGTVPTVCNAVITSTTRTLDCSLDGQEDPNAGVKGYEANCGYADGQLINAIVTLK